MLEEFTMEKKSSGRSAQAPVKGNSTESKKNQDLVNTSRVFARPGRRREPVVSAAPKNDYRKPVQQKYKPHDKRTRGRQAAGGKESTQVVAEDEVDVLGSMNVPGRRKQNLNHLLNFHYAPRESAASTPRNWRYHQGCGRKTLATYKHKYNKEQFLLANCQFVVGQENDYSEHLSNPDLLVNWDLIEEIHIRSGESLACPICLFTPIAAKITRCGHVYCWSCILHYLALSDKDSRKCPICFEDVNNSDLKSVIPIVHTQYSVGEEVTMRLMRRERGSLLPIPVDQSTQTVPNKFFSVSERDRDTGYSKLLLASPEEVLSIIEREKQELEEQLITEGDCPEKCFMEQAIELLRERELLLLRKGSVMQTSELPTSKYAVFSHANTHGVQKIQAKMGKFSMIDNHGNITLEETKLVEAHGSSAQSNEVKLECMDPEIYADTCCDSLEHEGIFYVDDILETRQSSSATTMPSKQFFFYQAADGQNIFLHALNVQMLEYQYGSLEQCPRLLRGKILEIEAGSMTEELRKRLRYLQHLPVTCQFEIVEIHLTQPTISKETILCFEEQVAARKRRRQRRARDERRLAKKVSEEEKRLLGRCPSPSICLESHMQFPLCGTDPDLIGSSSPPSPIGIVAYSPSVESDLAADMSLLTVETAGAHFVDGIPESPPGPSFAQMLREGKSKKVTRQVPEQRWPVQNMENGRPYHTQCSSSVEGSEELEDYVPVPDYKQSLKEAISKAMESASGVGENFQDGDGASGKKKKKKKKQTVLFATGMNFTSK